MDSDMLILQPEQMTTEQQRKLRRRKEMSTMPEETSESVVSQPEGGLAAVSTKKPSIISKLRMPR